MKKILVFATNNEHKLHEVQQLIGDNFILKSLADIGFTGDIPETGATFEENSEQKSRFIYQQYNLDCFADDSGLEVEALNNDPGVFSAVYSGTRNSQKNLELVLKNLEGKQNRNARFRAVISLIINGQIYFFDGTVKGAILTEPSGTAGFGYDPIFKPDGYSVTFSEMSTEEKNKISHRGKAMEKLVNFLTTPPLH